jgi:GNAT superfamily N-acetyltransferase
LGNWTAVTLVLALRGICGIGRYVPQHLERHAASRGAARLMLETGRRNTAALAPYHRTGYQPRPSYVAGRDTESTKP